MARVLVAEDDRHIRELLVDILFDAGYDVFQAKDGGAALEQAVKERPDLILLDVWMPVLDGFQVLDKLRDNPEIQSTPVVLLTAMPVIDGEQRGIRLGVDHYIPKPWSRETVELTVKVALREGQSAADEDEDEPEMWAGSSAQRKASSDSESQQYIPAGDALDLLARKLGGGIPLASFTLIEGTPTAGKSVLCQHLAYASLLDDRGVAYFSSECTPTGLMKQMDSIGLKAAKYLEKGRIDIYPVQDPDNENDSGSLLGALAQDIGHVSSQSDLVIVDAVTRLVSSSTSKDVIEFFSSILSLRSKGKSVIIVAHSYAFDDNLLGRVADMCDTHLKMSTGKMRSRVVRMAEVVKADNVKLDTDNVISFEVEPGTGIKIIPFSRAKA